MYEYLRVDVRSLARHNFFAGSAIFAEVVVCFALAHPLSLVEHLATMLGSAPTQLVPIRVGKILWFLATFAYLRPLHIVLALVDEVRERRHGAHVEWT